MKNILSYESQVYSIKSNDFEGPLDLLCHLIDKNKMNICDINISEITDQYIEYLNKMEELNLEIASEFVIMASTLLYLKSAQKKKEKKSLTKKRLCKELLNTKNIKKFLKYSDKCIRKTQNISLKKRKKLNFLKEN